MPPEDLYELGGIGLTGGGTVVASSGVQRNEVYVASEPLEKTTKLSCLVGAIGATRDQRPLEADSATRLVEVVPTGVDEL